MKNGEIRMDEDTDGVVNVHQDHHASIANANTSPNHAAGPNSTCLHCWTLSLGCSLIPSVSLNTLYDPHKLTDYGGDLFQHEQSHLRQMDFRDEHNNLVPLADWYMTFRPGTFVLVRATLHAFVWEQRWVSINDHCVLCYQQHAAAGLSSQRPFHLGTERLPS